ncbi:MAG: helix-turn-helix domain-containing protein, partial [Bacteroidota bacterium]|nr:helix-turn-helix domain-containing protein [Bacteroidota bacterium]
MKYFCGLQKAVKYRLYPTERQKESLSKHFGSVRLIYNLALETKSWVYTAYKVSLSRYELQEQVRELKQDCPWRRDVNSQSLQAALRDQDRAYINFFEGRTGGNM